MSRVNFAPNPTLNNAHDNQSPSVVLEDRMQAQLLDSFDMDSGDIMPPSRPQTPVSDGINNNDDTLSQRTFDNLSDIESVRRYDSQPQTPAPEREHDSEDLQSQGTFANLSDIEELG